MMMMKDFFAIIGSSAINRIVTLTFIVNHPRVFLFSLPLLLSLSVSLSLCLCFSLLSLSHPLRSSLHFPHRKMMSWRNFLWLFSLSVSISLSLIFSLFHSIFLSTWVITFRLLLIVFPSFFFHPIPDQSVSLNHRSKDTKRHQKITTFFKKITAGLLLFIYGNAAKIVSENAIKVAEKGSFSPSLRRKLTKMVEESHPEMFEKHETTFSNIFFHDHFFTSYFVLWVHWLKSCYKMEWD